MIPVPVDIISQKASGATAILIPAHTICPHTFHAYVDKNLTVRDYLVSDLSLLEQKDSYDLKKKEILSKIDTYNLELANILTVISEKDLLGLLYANFLDSPLIIVEENVDLPRFELIYAFLIKLFPELNKTCIIMSPDKFVDYEQKFANDLKTCTIYNAAVNPPLRKPFAYEESEPLGEVVRILKSGAFKLQRVFAKNFIDYLKKFSAEVQSMGKEKEDKIIKKLKKDHPNHENMFTPALLAIMRKRNEFLSELTKK
jgi:hypothetical protein